MSEKTDRQAPCGPVLRKPLSVGEFALRFNEDFLLSGHDTGPMTSFMIRRQAEVMLSKYPHASDLGLPKVNTRDAAQKAFALAESMCEVTNNTLYQRTLALGPDSLLRKVLKLASLEFQRILEASYNKEGLVFFFGPGSTSSLRFTQADALTKCLHTQPEVTRALLPHLGALQAQLPRLPMDQYKVVEGGVLAFVPKNSKTDRTILMEPDLNVLAQKGLGTALRAGIREICKMDLDNQQDVARAMLLEDRSGQLATVDMRMASDTIAFATVCQLGTLSGPPSRGAATLLACLEAARSPCYRTSRKASHGTPLHKWSSMGNAYTFELETAIFWSLTYAASIVSGIPAFGVDGKPKISVFGDDIIVASSVVPLLQEVLGHYGFLINEDKSFSEGPFRESCGLEVYNTRDVSPFRIKRRIETHGQIYWLCNSFRNWYNRLYEVAAEEGCSLPSPFPLWLWVQRHIPRRELLRGPESLDGISLCGDGHLHVSDEYLPKGIRLRHGHEGRGFWTWSTSTLSRAFEEVPLSFALLKAETIRPALRDLRQTSGIRPTRRISRYTAPAPEGDGYFNGQSFSTSIETRGDGDARKVLVKQFASALPRGKF